MLFDTSIWIPVIQDLIRSAAPLAFVVVFVRVGFRMIVSAASGDHLFGR